MDQVAYWNCENQRIEMYPHTTDRGGMKMIPETQSYRVFVKLPTYRTSTLVRAYSHNDAKDRVAVMYPEGTVTYVQLRGTL